MSDTKPESEAPDSGTGVTESGPEGNPPGSTPDAANSAGGTVAAGEPGAFRRWLRRVNTVRDVPHDLERLAWGASFIGLVLLVWWFITRGASTTRIISPATLPSPGEAWDSFPSLWYDKELSRNALRSLGRVLGGFFASAAVTIPLGLMAGTWLRLDAFLKPLSVFGRSVPIVALVPIALMWFGFYEGGKVMFIFIATAAFILFDSASAARNVQDRFLDSAYTLGAKRTLRKGTMLSLWFALAYGILLGFGWHMLHGGEASLVQEMAGTTFWWYFFSGTALGFFLWFPIMSRQILRKVILPLAMPDVVNSLRLLFGLAFGYIVMAEVVNANGGLGYIISVTQRRGPMEHIYLCLIIISLMAYTIDRLILACQRALFPYLKHD